MATTRQKKAAVEIPEDLLACVRQINESHRFWLDEAEFVRDAVRRMVDEHRGYLLRH